MSDKATENVVPVTEPAKDAAAEGGEKGPSKGALKKAAKEKEKVRSPQSDTMLREGITDWKIYTGRESRKAQGRGGGSEEGRRRERCLQGGLRRDAHAWLPAIRARR